MDQSVVNPLVKFHVNNRSTECDKKKITKVGINFVQAANFTGAFLNPIDKIPFIKNWHR